MLELLVWAKTSALQSHMIKCHSLSLSGKNRAVKGLLQMQANCRQQPLSLREICLFE